MTEKAIVERVPFLDMLGNPVQMGDILFRPTMRTYERVAEMKPYNPKTGPGIRRAGTYQLRTTNIYHPNWSSKQWIQDGKNVLKVNMTPEVESALTLMDTAINEFQPKLVLDFKS